MTVLPAVNLLAVETSPVKAPPLALTVPVNVPEFAVISPVTERFVPSKVSLFPPELPILNLYTLLVS